MQMIDVLQNTELATNADIVDGTQMLRIFRETHTTAMGYNWDVEFLRHKEHGKDLVDAAHSTSVDLADVDGAGCEELLEDDAVLAHFSSCDADAVRAESVADGFVAEDVVGGGGLFDEPWLELFEVLHVFDCFWDGPDLSYY